MAESVTVLKGVGVLLTTNRRWLGSSSRFLDLQDIHSVIINEVSSSKQLITLMTVSNSIGKSTALDRQSQGMHHDALGLRHSADSAMKMPTGCAQRSSVHSCGQLL